jgi:UDP-glucose 4-epimerase
MSEPKLADFFRDKRVLITGGAGFIGSSLAHALVPLGARVTVVDALLPLYGGNVFNTADIKDAITFVEGDVRDEEVLRSVVEGQDIIYSLAAQASYIDSKTQPFLDLDINGRGHLLMCEAVRELAPKAKILFSSSRLVYGKILTLPVREDHPTNPLSLYGIHKLLAEKYYRYYADTFGLDTVSIRIPNPYGPRQQIKHSKYSIVGWFVRQALEDKPITIFGDGSQERDYLYIDDIVQAFLLLTVRGQKGEVYNIGTDERVRFVDMVDTVIGAVGKGSKKHVPWPEHYEKNETGNYVADTAKIEQHTGWKPRVRLAEGIGAMVDYYRKFGQHYVT